MNIKNLIKNINIFALSAGNGSGSKLFQSLIDNSDGLLMLPGYQLQYLCPFYVEWSKDKSLNWVKIIDKIFLQFPSIFDSRISFGNERLDRLGKEKINFIEIDKDKFKEHFLKFSENLILNRRNLILIIHFAYGCCLDKDIQSVKTIVFHIHVPWYIEQFFLKDFPDGKIISMTREPKNNIFTRFKTSYLKTEELKLRKSDFFLVRYKAAYNVFKHITTGLNVVPKKLTNNHFIIRHEQLKYSLKNCITEILKKMNINFNENNFKPTFNELIWDDRFYSDKKYDESNIVKANFEKVYPENKNLNFILEGIMSKSYSKLKYKKTIFSNTFLNNVKLLIFIFKFNEMEKSEMAILFNLKNIKIFFKNRETERLKTNIRYNWNAVYKYRWTIMSEKIYKRDIIVKNYYLNKIQSFYLLLRTFTNFFIYYAKRVFLSLKLLLKSKFNPNLNFILIN